MSYKKIIDLIKLIKGLISGIDPEKAIVTRDYRWGENQSGKWSDWFASDSNSDDCQHNGWSSPEGNELMDNTYWCVQFKNGRHFPVPLLPKWAQELCDRFVPYPKS